MGASVEGKAIIVTVTPTLSLSAYSVSDQMGDVNTMTSAVDATKDTASIMSISVVDKSSQKSSFDILFFSSAPTLVSSDNSALSISDTDMAEKFLGRVKILSSDYVDTATSSDCTKFVVGLMLQAASGSNNVYCVLQCQGTPTYTSTSDLVVKIALVQD